MIYWSDELYHNSSNSTQLNASHTTCENIFVWICTLSKCGGDLEAWWATGKAMLVPAQFFIVRKVLFSLSEIYDFHCQKFYLNHQKNIIPSSNWLWMKYYWKSKMPTELSIPRGSRARYITCKLYLLAIHISVIIVVIVEIFIWSRASGLSSCFLSLSKDSSKPIYWALFWERLKDALKLSHVQTDCFEHPSMRWYYYTMILMMTG